jgi:RNA polymerase sigma-70 factor (ECF subfamily)
MPDPTLHPLSDRELVERTRAGDERAFGELTRRFQRPIISTIMRKVGRPQAAEDLAQVSFFKAYNALDRYDPGRRFISWMSTIAINTTIDYLRGYDLETLPLDGADDAMTAEQMEATAIPVPDSRETPVEELLARELGSILEDALQKLRPEYRDCIIYRLLERRSLTEIARLTGIPVNTVRSNLQRGRKELMFFLKERGREAGLG